MNPLYHGIPAGDGVCVENSIQPFEVEDAHARRERIITRRFISEAEKSTRRRLGLFALLCTFLFAVLVFIVGHVDRGDGKKKSPPESAASAAKVNAFDEVPDASADAGLGTRIVFCYGDSLTFGMSSGGQFPYHAYLEQELNALFGAAPVSPSTGSYHETIRNRTRAALVQHLGLPGWTASKMLDRLHDEEFGACGVVHRIPALDLMVILAGTNDIVQRARDGDGAAGGEIAESIIGLHKGAVDCAAAKRGTDGFRTLAIGVPGSAYQEEARAASELASYVNNALGEFAASEQGDDVSYLDFPFPYEAGDPKWDADGLHLTQEGYEALARELAPRVKNILDNIGLQ